MGIIYLIHVREFIKTGENIYKIGQSSRNGMKRIKEYPKGSKLLLLLRLNGYERQIESLLIKKFIYFFIQRRDIGKEYFEGDCEKMKFLINCVTSVAVLIKKETVDYMNYLNIICCFNKEIRKTPENRNVIINGNVSKVFTSNGWEEKETNSFIDEHIEFCKIQLIGILDKNKLPIYQLSDFEFHKIPLGFTIEDCRRIFIESFK